MSERSYSKTTSAFRVSETMSISYTDFMPSIEVQATPLIYLPGLMRSAVDFDRVAPKFACERRVVTIDTRGRGRADYSENLSDYDFDLMIEDVWHLLDHLKIDKFVLLGIALGTFMSWRMGAQRPQRILGIIANDTSTETVSKAGKKMVAAADQGLHDFDKALEKLRVHTEKNFRDFGLDDWREYTRQVYAEVAPGKWKRDFDPGILDAWTQFKEKTPSLWGDFVKLREIPIAVLRGENSEYLSVEQVERMTQALPNARAVSVQGRGHPLRMDEPASLIAIREILALADATTAAGQ